MDQYHMAHSVPGRMRLKLDEGRGDHERFAHYAHTIGAMPGVHSVATNARTGSVLVHYEGRPESLMHSLHAAGLVLAAAAGAQPAAIEAASRAPGSTATDTAEAEGQMPSPRRIAFVALIALAIVQAARGEVMAPAATLLWYAFHVQRMGSGPAQPGTV